MSDDKDPEDGSDWLSSQFDATGAVPAPPAGIPAAPPPTAAAPLAAPPAATPPLAAPPTPNAGGGFNWGLKPGGTVEQPAVRTPPAAVAQPAAPAAPFVAPPAAAPAAPVSPPAPATPPPLVTPQASVTPPALVTPPPAAYVAPPTQPYVSEPTKPLSWDEFASTQQQPTPAATPQVPLDQPTEAYTVQPWQSAAIPSTVPVQNPDDSAQHPEHPGQHPEYPGQPTSAIDSLFGDHKFQDYEEVGVLKTIQAPPIGPDESTLDREPREPLPRSQKVLLGIAAGLLAALILVGLYFLGHHLGAAAAVAPVVKSTPGASSTPTPAGTGGPATPGQQQWTALQGGECIQPFSTAWALTFTVVACTADHDAEMVFKGKLPDGSDSKYPTAPDFQKEITSLCSAPTAINYTAAVSVTDLQVSFSYPPNTASWLSGDRTYYCFVDRVSGGNLPGDLAVAKTQ